MSGPAYQLACYPALPLAPCATFCHHPLMSADEVLAKMRSMANPENVRGMARFGISSEGTLGLSMPQIREIGKEIPKDHELAEQLWQSGIHEARILCAIVDRPKWVTESQMERWVLDFDSWDVCDQVCMNLFDRTPFAFDKAKEWARRPEEFVRRAGFALMAALSLSRHKTENERLMEFFPLMEEAASDDRNFVKKAVNWALRQIGKRNRELGLAAIQTAGKILAQPHASARWIARDALRELKGRYDLSSDEG